MVSHLNENAVPKTTPNKSASKVLLLKIINDQKEKARLEEEIKKRPLPQSASKHRVSTTICRVNALAVKFAYFILTRWFKASSIACATSWRPCVKDMLLALMLPVYSRPIGSEFSIPTTSFTTSFIESQFRQEFCFVEM